MPSKDPTICLCISMAAVCIDCEFSSLQTWYLVVFFELAKLNNADSNRNVCVKCHYTFNNYAEKLKYNFWIIFLSAARTIDMAMAYLIQKDSIIAYQEP